MSTPADIMDALGRPDAAATLRWSDEPRPGLLDEFERLEAEVEELKEELEAARVEIADLRLGSLLTQLVELLCKRCAKRWEDR